MKNSIIYLIACLLMTGMVACDGFLDKEPSNVITEKQAYSSKELIVSLISNLYAKMPVTGGFGGSSQDPANFDEAMTGTGKGGKNNLTSYGYDWYRTWDYFYIREINLFIENIVEVSDDVLSEDDRNYFLAEARFIRAFVYFDMVRRMGGVPLITQTYTYQSGTDPANYQFPRATESDIYDFIYSECQDIKDALEWKKGNALVVVKNRATKGAVLALLSRAMLYAGSTARYNSLMDNPIVLPGGEVGIPAEKARDYYQKSLDASEELIGYKNGKNTVYSLYNKNANKADNFYDLFIKKDADNPEMILVKDYSLNSVKHAFSFENIPRGCRESGSSGSVLNPSLNLVEAYDYLDNTSGELKITDEQGKYIVYDNPQDIFANKDPRLFGSIITPGSAFKGYNLDIQAGLAIPNGDDYTFKEISYSSYPDPVKNNFEGKAILGADGPSNDRDITNTGFYIRKFLDTREGSAINTYASDVAWVFFRLGEVYLNAAEAAFELDDKPKASQYINDLRKRAGFTKDLEEDEVTMDKIRNERRIELAFEDHRFYDMKRWRIAHEVWNGNKQDSNTMIYALWPYKIHAPGDEERDGKWIFVKKVAPNFQAARYFRLGNYYSSIDNNVISKNPKIKQNPNQ